MLQVEYSRNVRALTICAFGLMHFILIYVKSMIIPILFEKNQKSLTFKENLQNYQFCFCAIFFSIMFANYFVSFDFVLFHLLYFLFRLILSRFSLIFELLSYLSDLSNNKVNSFFNVRNILKHKHTTTFKYHTFF